MEWFNEKDIEIEIEYLGDIILCVYLLGNCGLREKVAGVTMHPGKSNIHGIMYSLLRRVESAFVF